MSLFPIPVFNPPTEFFARIGPVFDIEDPKAMNSMSRAIDMIEGQMFERKVKFEYGKVGNNTGDVDKKVRSSGVYFVEPNHQIEWVFQTIVELIARVNYDKFAMDIDFLEALQYTSYKAPEKPEETPGHYHWHIDCHQNERRVNERKLSIVIAVNDPDEYEGGDLLINDSGNQDRPTVVRLRKGEAVVFYSHLGHTVTPVTKGERRSLVGWVLGPKMR